MPGGDRTGPAGRGPMTGRKLGFCAGYQTPGYSRYPGRGLGYGRGFGRGRGFRQRRFWMQPPLDDIPQSSREHPGQYTPDPAEEQQYLEENLRILEEEIKQVKQRLQDITKRKKENNP